MSTIESCKLLYLACFVLEPLNIKETGRFPLLSITIAIAVLFTMFQAQEPVL